MHTAYIALGSNLKSPVFQIYKALDILNQHPQIQLTNHARLYTNPPVGITRQPDFVNTVACVQTSLNPQALMDTLLSVEKTMGRVRHERNGPRIIDLDIVLYEDRVIHTQHLTVPHPELKNRDFVLWPLFEIAPKLSLPDGTPLKKLISKQPKELIVVEKEAVAL